MKRGQSAISVMVVLAAAAVASAQTSTQSFDLIKSLTGNWEGKTQSGDPTQVTFRSTAGGSAVLAEIGGQMKGHAEDMITMFHMDGSRLMMTHYCAAGNQPRMQGTVAPDGKSITFSFLDATNLASKDDGHMQRVIFTFVDSTHHTEEWHFVAHGKEMIQRFDLEKKS
jgi:hypothetical protein